ncbi:MAG: hypothetical protein CVV60_00820 [Tenericutes bacterium HGW-Tenericutes-5]|jgi:hypothetical protein|nr:MAG: hypothetical protein CVV60_00820 [Tenericutes bacterium HGW-Tenericutes-5]
MKKKLIIENDGKILFDSTEVHKKDINSTFLDTIFKAALKDELEFIIDETDPISKIFQRIQEETNPNSDFYKQIEGMREEIKKNNEQKEQINNAKIEDNLPL